MQRTRLPLWTATLSFVALAPLALTFSACCREEPKPEGEQAAAPGGDAKTPPAESSGKQDGAGEQTADANHADPAEADAQAEGAASDAKAPEVKPEEQAGEKEGEAKAAETKDAEEKPAAEESHGDAKKPAKKPANKGEKDAKKDEAAAKEAAKPKFAELGVKVTKAGKGTAATEGSTVTLHYKASVADAEKPFDSTYATRRPIEVQLGEGAKLAVIEGLRRGLEGLTPGTEARLEIPANLAWGEKGNPAVGVPANADVVFEISVLDVR